MPTKRLRQSISRSMRKRGKNTRKRVNKIHRGGAGGPRFLSIREQEAEQLQREKIQARILEGEKKLKEAMGNHIQYKFSITTEGKEAAKEAVKVEAARVKAEAKAEKEAAKVEAKRVKAEAKAAKSAAKKAAKSAKRTPTPSTSIRPVHRSITNVGEIPFNGKQTCKYIGRKRCIFPTYGREYCKLHTCTQPGCDNSKSSTNEYCKKHIINEPIHVSLAEHEKRMAEYATKGKRRAQNSPAVPPRRTHGGPASAAHASSASGASAKYKKMARSRKKLSGAASASASASAGASAKYKKIARSRKKLSGAASASAGAGAEVKELAEAIQQNESYEFSGEEDFIAHEIERKVIDSKLLSKDEERILAHFEKQKAAAAATAATAEMNRPNNEWGQSTKFSGGYKSKRNRSVLKKRTKKKSKGSKK